MELECPESLGPDPSPSPLPLSNNSNPPQHRPHTSPHPQCPPAKRQRLLKPPSPQNPLHVLAQRDTYHVPPSSPTPTQTSVTSPMRAQIVAWFADMSTSLALPPAAVALSVNLFDRTLAARLFSRPVLYALTAACILIASKIIHDDPVTPAELSFRASVPVGDILSMETVVLNVLNWKIGVITPHEVIAELVELYANRATDTALLQPLRDSLVLAAMLDHRLARFRATSVGVACYVLADCVAAGDHPRAHLCHAVYRVAESCGVDIGQVQLCLTALREGLCTLFDDIEPVDLSDEEDVRSEHTDDQGNAFGHFDLGERAETPPFDS